MAKRNILNYLGEVVGELELPDGTSEEVWQKKLALYAAAPAVSPPPNVTPRQIRQALIISGVSIASIEAAIASLPEPHKSFAQIEWEYSTAFIRTNPLVAQIGAIVGFNEEQLDNLWKLAGSI